MIQKFKRSFMQHLKKGRINKFSAGHNGQNIGDPTKAPSGFEALQRPKQKSKLVDCPPNIIAQNLNL